MAGGRGEGKDEGGGSGSDEEREERSEDEMNEWRTGRMRGERGELWRESDEKIMGEWI